MLTYDVELTELETQPAAVVCDRVDRAGLPAFIGSALGEVLEVLKNQGLAAAGPPFGRYRVTAGGFDTEVGFPTTGMVRPSGRVVAAELPGGPAARVLHQGDYDGVAAAYEAASEWLDWNGYAARSAPWESYLDGPDVAEPRTLVYFPCRKA